MKISTSNLGTFRQCEKCPSHDNCCAKVMRGGKIESPWMTRQELERIETFSGEDSSIFSNEISPVGLFEYYMKNGEQGCYFHNGGECKVYCVRPFDCRLFPYDVCNMGGHLILIGYLSVCPPQVEKDILVRDAEKAKKVLMEYEALLEDYARIDAPKVEGYEYVVLFEILRSPSGLKFVEPSSDLVFPRQGKELQPVSLERKTY